MKKTFAAIIALLLTVSATLAACSDEIANESSNPAESGNNVSNVSDDTSKSDSPWVDDIVGYLGDGKWGREMPEFKWDKDTFTVLVYGDGKQSTYYSEEIEPYLYETTDSIINDAVEHRNRAIEEKYGVTIKAHVVDDVYQTLLTELQAPSADNADAAMPFLPGCTTLAQGGYLYDLRSFEEDGYIDLSMPWWDSNATESFSIANRVYFSVSDMSIMQKITSFCIMFNKDLIKEKYPNLNLYDEVNNKTWTFDKMYELARAYTYESDNADGMSSEDNWGLVTEHNNALMTYLSSGARLVTKSADDEPMLSLGVDERSVNIAQSVLSRLSEKSTWLIHAQDLPQANRWTDVVRIFGEGRALFRSTAFSAVKKMRVYDVNFGLIPYPLMDDTQDTYYTPSSARYAYGIVIPYSANEPEFSAFMLDVISAESKGENASGLTRAYSEVVLKGKDLDEESGEMLDKYIFSNIVYDLGVIYDFGVSNVIANLMTSGSADIVSSLGSAKDSIQTKIDETIALYKERA